MKYAKFIGLIATCLIVIASCNKDNNLPPNSIVGTWIFTNQFTQTYSYPSILNNPFPISVSSWTISGDSIKATFDNNGNYSFVNFRSPIDNGTYTILHDSLLIIKPDTSGFIKFCYTTLNFYAFSWTPGTPLPQLPYSNFHFTSDTILFKKSNVDNIIFTAFWLTKASRPLLPSGDTIIINQANSNFKKR
ncbi:hypothetical protein [Ferruginibacter sp.]